MQEDNLKPGDRVIRLGNLPDKWYLGVVSICPITGKLMVGNSTFRPFYLPEDAEYIIKIHPFPKDYTSDTLTKVHDEFVRLDDEGTAHVFVNNKHFKINVGFSLCR